MTAESMKERITEFARLAQNRASAREGPVEDVVHSTIYEKYLMKHTTSDVLGELRELEALYADAFYDGRANEHILNVLNGAQDADFWYDYIYLALAAGLEWAVLEEIGEKSVETGS